MVRGVSGFISCLNAAAGPLNSQRSDHSSVCSLTPHHFIHALIQEHIVPHFTAGWLTLRSSCRKAVTGGLLVFNLSWTFRESGGCHQVDKGVSFKSSCNGMILFMHSGFLVGVFTDKARLQHSHKPSIITAQQCCISNSSWHTGPKQTPPESRRRLKTPHHRHRQRGLITNSDCVLWNL